jgi:uncharacterized protein YndB with AHSA1/START domain
MQTRGYVHRVDIRAELEDVWQALIEPAILARWHVPNARVDARVNGSYWTRLDANLAREAHIDVYQPPRRLRLIYMPLPKLPDEGAVLVDDFLIDRDEAASRHVGVNMAIVRLMGSGIPDEREWDAMYGRLRTGWERALLRLKVLLERSNESVLKAPSAAQTRKPPPADKLLEWPEPTNKPSGENLLLSRPEPSPRPKLNEVAAKTDGNDFIKWPEPSPTKKP